MAHTKKILKIIARMTDAATWNRIDDWEAVATHYANLWHLSEDQLDKLDQLFDQRDKLFSLSKQISIGASHYNSELYTDVTAVFTGDRSFESLQKYFDDPYLTFSTRFNAREDIRKATASDADVKLPVTTDMSQESLSSVCETLKAKYASAPTKMWGNRESFKVSHHETKHEGIHPTLGIQFNTKKASKDPEYFAEVLRRAAERGLGSREEVTKAVAKWGENVFSEFVRRGEYFANDQVDIKKSHDSYKYALNLAFQVGIPIEGTIRWFCQNHLRSLYDAKDTAALDDFLQNAIKYGYNDKPFVNYLTAIWQSANRKSLPSETIGSLQLTASPLISYGLMEQVSSPSLSPSAHSGP